MQGRVTQNWNMEEAREGEVERETERKRDRKYMQYACLLNQSLTLLFLMGATTSQAFTQNSKELNKSSKLWKKKEKKTPQ